MEDPEILIIEDSEEDQEMILRTLKRHNFANRVKVFDDGQDALDFLFGDGKSPAPFSSFGALKVIFLDLHLPRVSGIDVLKALKGDSRTATVPVVVVTSSQEEPDLKRCYELGVNSYVVKPVDFSQFVKAIAEVGLYWLVLNKRPGE